MGVLLLLLMLSLLGDDPFGKELMLAIVIVVVPALVGERLVEFEPTLHLDLMGERLRERNEPSKLSRILLGMGGNVGGTGDPTQSLSGLVALSKEYKRLRALPCLPPVLAMNLT